MLKKKLLIFLFSFALFSCDSKIVEIHRLIHDTLYINVTDTLIKIDTVSFTRIDSFISIITDTVVIIDSLTYSFIEIKPVSVKVDSVYPGFAPEFMFDNIPYKSNLEKGTRYAVPGYPHWLIFDFGHIVELNKLAINTFRWDEHYTHSFICFNFSDTLTSFTTYPQLYSNHDINFVGQRLALQVLNGKNSWLDIGEIKFYGINK